MRRATITLTALLFSAVAANADTAPDDVIYEDGAVMAALTDKAGDAANGRVIFANRSKGNCLACHVNAEWSEQQFHGEVGPPLDGVAGNWSTAELRGLLTNAKMTYEDTLMPSFYRTSGLNRTLEKFDGKTILTAQEVEDVLAYLLTLTE